MKNFALVALIVLLFVPIVSAQSYRMTFLGSDDNGGIILRVRLSGFQVPPKLIVDDLQVVHTLGITDGTETFTVLGKYLANGVSHRLAMEGFPERAIVFSSYAPPRLKLTPVGGDFQQTTEYTIRVRLGAKIVLGWEIMNPNLGVVPIGPPIDKIVSNFGLEMDNVVARTTTGEYEFFATDVGIKKIRLSGRIGTASSFAELVIVVE